MPLSLMKCPQGDDCLEGVRQALEPVVFQNAYLAGQSKPIDQVIAFALGKGV